MDGEKEWPKGCGLIISFLLALLIAAWIVGSTTSCAFYREANKRLRWISQFAKSTWGMDVWFHVEPPRKFVGSNVSFAGCSAAYQTTIKSWMEAGYDRLVAGCWKNLTVLDLKTRSMIHDRIIDYLTCEPLVIVCDGAHCAENTNSCGYFNPMEFFADPKRINLCVSNCPGNLTPGLVHELTHLAEFEIRQTTSETTADAFGTSCS